MRLYEFDTVRLKLLIGWKVHISRIPDTLLDDYS